MKLSPTQKQVIENLQNGWRLHSTETGAAMRSPNGETVKITLTTLYSLYTMKMIRFERDEEKLVDMWFLNEVKK